MSLALAPPRADDPFVEAVRRFSLDGRPTETAEDAGLRYFVNEFWTAGQRQAHRLHEVSYRACFKPQLPEFLIERLTAPGGTVYDPFAGRGTTALQAALMGRRPVANDINPLSAALLAPRLDPPSLKEVQPRLAEPLPALATLPEGAAALLAFYHPETLRTLCALRARLLAAGRLDRVDAWVRMVALNRLTGHSPGFFSVYALPPTVRCPRIRRACC